MKFGILELRNRVTQNDVTLWVNNSDIFLITLIWVGFLGVHFVLVGGVVVVGGYGGPELVRIMLETRNFNFGTLSAHTQFITFKIYLWVQRPL